MTRPLRFLRKINPFLITCCIAVFVIILFLLGNTLLDTIELKTYDLRLLSREKAQPSSAVILAVIDEKSLDTEGRWPWSRAKIARLVQLLDRDGAKVISFDVGFLEPDQNNQQDCLGEVVRHLNSMGIEKSALDTFISESKEMKDNDFLLASAIREATAAIVLGYFFHMKDDDRNYQISPEMLQQQIDRIRGSKYPLVMYGGPEEQIRLIEAYAPEGNLDILAAATESAGYYSVKTDLDGVVRWMPLIIKFGEDIYPPLSLVSVWQYLNKPQMIVEADKHGIDGIRIGETFIPTDEMGQLLINYLGPPKTFPHISISDILNDGLPKGTFKDKIVIVGATAMGTHDLRSIPLTPLFPGVEIHATVIDNMLTQNFLVKPSWTLICDLLAIIVLLALSGFALPRMGALKGLLLTVVIFYAYIILARWFLLHLKLWLNVVFPLLALLLNYTLLRVHSYITKDRERKKIQETFKQYVPPLVIKEMTKDPQKLKLGGEEKELTVLFNDIAGFTSLSEHQSPTEVVHTLSNYFEKMTEEIFRYRGTLEAYIGDEMMAVFGAPIARTDHAEKACDAALAMQARLAELHEKWSGTGHAMLTARTGINTGPMLVGNLGCKYRFVYGVMGDNVNLASRLEGLNKVYNTDIIIGENTANIVKDSFLMREIDMVRAKGKAVPIRIYELLGRASTPLPEAREHANHIYSLGLEDYRRQAWQEALDKFNRAVSIRASDGAAKTMAARCEAYLKTPPADDWDGVFAQVDK